MDLTNITSAQFNQITKLLQKKEALLEQVNEINAQLASFEGGTQTSPRAVVAAKAGRRGGVAEKILGALKEAGSEGLSVPQLAEKLGMKVVNVRAWVYTTGKKLVKAVSRGVFALKDGAVASSEASVAESPKAKPAKRKMSAEGRARIAAAQRARWARKNAGKPANA